VADMIVTYAPGVVQLITQPDHAHLAGRFMEHGVPLAARPHRATILHAIGEHETQVPRAELWTLDPHADVENRPSAPTYP